MNREELAARYGTPLYVYDLDRVADACHDLTAALPERFSLFYALKANPHPRVAEAVRENVPGTCRAEISSSGELAAALAAGFPAADCLYTGPGKTAGELAQAVADGVRLFSAESPGDLRRIGAAALAGGAVADCLIRVNSASATASTSIRMTGTPSQFGFDSELLDAPAPGILDVPGTRIVGAHFFPLSNAREEDDLIAEFTNSITVAADVERRLGIRLSLLDLGGGFASPYAAPGQRPRYTRLRAALESALDEHFPRWRTGGLEIACESGRYLVGDSGSLLTRVVNTKVSRGKTFHVLDAGINTLGGMSGLGRLLPTSARPAEDTGATAEPERPSATASLVGPLCTPGDILGRELGLPQLCADDLVTLPNVGAYGLTASLLMFLGRPAPAEVTLRGGAVATASRIEHIRVDVRPRNLD
ncbi:type III PLP-dependent enzyme [Streptomyces sp. NPDC088733]|uniref:type III PLP-dependent enzyme n=1 Tax=Streptomyces sp. NPDC088733 TaxID=3365880 RepID=UPI003800CA55